MLLKQSSSEVGGSMRVFVSHIAEEAEAASALKRALARVLPQLGA